MFLQDLQIPVSPSLLPKVFTIVSFILFPMLLLHHLLFVETRERRGCQGDSETAHRRTSLSSPCPTRLAIPHSLSNHDSPDRKSEILTFEADHEAG